MHSFFGIYGASGCGRGVIPLAREQLKRQGSGDAQLVFVDDYEEAAEVNGHKVLKYSDFIEVPASERYAALAIADGVTRERLAAQCLADGVRPWALQAANVVIMDDVTLGEGSILCPFVTITSNVLIGCHFLANIYSYVEHDCIVGDFVTFAPGVKCNGNVRIENHAYIGAGAVIRNGKPGRPLVIGARAVVGMGAVVTEDVPACAVVAGNPARLLRGR